MESGWSWVPLTLTHFIPRPNDAVDPPSFSSSLRCLPWCASCESCQFGPISSFVISSFQYLTLARSLPPRHSLTAFSSDGWNSRFSFSLSLLSLSLPLPPLSLSLPRENHLIKARAKIILNRGGERARARAGARCASGCGEERRGGDGRKKEGQRRKSNESGNPS